jgi:hypothetical protein
VLFASWETFYVIVGSSAGALTGLMFVVVALVSETEGNEAALEAFATPTVVHFSAPLLMAAVIAAPWTAVWPAHLSLVAIGLAGIIYVVIVTLRARRQVAYKPVLEDWIFHNVLPFLAYALVAVGGGLTRTPTSPTLFAVAAGATLLLFVGIHNAWDTVIFIVATRWKRAKKE